MGGLFTENHKNVDEQVRALIKHSVLENLRCFPLSSWGFGKGQGLSDWDGCLWQAAEHVDGL